MSIRDRLRRTDKMIRDSEKAGDHLTLEEYLHLRQVKGPEPQFSQWEVARILYVLYGCGDGYFGACHGPMAEPGDTFTSHLRHTLDLCHCKKVSGVVQLFSQSIEAAEKGTAPSDEVKDRLAALCIDLGVIPKTPTTVEEVEVMSDPIPRVGNKLISGSGC